MREWKAAEIERQIAGKMAEANRSILRSRKGRAVRTRPRDPGEQAILDRICIQKWQKALREGKVRILSKNEWYYEFD
ncbi:MAG: hypothetical protein AB1556_04555 [Bacillota bacterium]